MLWVICKYFASHEPNKSIVYHDFVMLERVCVSNYVRLQRLLRWSYQEFDNFSVQCGRCCYQIGYIIFAVFQRKTYLRVKKKEYENISWGKMCKPGLFGVMVATRLRLPILISRVEADRESLSRSLRRAVFYRIRLYLYDDFIKPKRKRSV